ncbi:MAG: hypothetical protein H0T89_14110 [Deltaproteobacteria bacterium]|nr:hypothetical protein [Deltaproteobacteria bacterium]MDQ3301288.1 carboxypeptidase-like regulatory domain-containing protein [Myxococcota bacterium]
MRLVVVVIAVIGACGGRPAQAPLHPAGSERDDGHGLLAQASAQILIDEADEKLQAATHHGAAYGGAAYGGQSYATFEVPAWPVAVPNRTPKYNQVPNLGGAIDGVVRWRGAVPSKLATSCGELEPVRVGADRAVAGVLIYIERVQVGRVLRNDGRPVSVGGTIVKRGCRFEPRVQLVTPLPAAVAVHGDAKPARVRLADKVLELHAGGRIALQLQPGVTRVEAEDGSLGAAWVIALDTPSYALTDDHGRFRIDELAAGSYELTIWSPPVATLKEGALTYGAPTILKRTVRVTHARASRVDVTLGR